MIEVPIEVECWIEYSLTSDEVLSVTTSPVGSYRDCIQSWIQQEIARTFDLSREEWETMPPYVMRTITLEVEIDTDEYKKDEKRATVQTECPNFVAGWAAKKAMELYKQEVKK